MDMNFCHILDFTGRSAPKRLSANRLNKYIGSQCYVSFPSLFLSWKHLCANMRRLSSNFQFKEKLEEVSKAFQEKMTETGSLHLLIHKTSFSKYVALDIT